MFNLAMRLHLTFLLCLCFSLFVQAQAANKPIKLYYINVDSVLHRIAETEIKQDSLDRYRMLAEVTVKRLKGEYFRINCFGDTLWPLNPYADIPTDSSEFIIKYRELYNLELKIIDSILSHQIADSILVYSVRFAELRKINHLFYKDDAEILHSASPGKYQLVNYTNEFIAFLNQRQWVVLYNATKNHE